MTDYKIERVLIIGVLALTLIIEVQFQFGIREFIKQEGQGYLDVYCWNKYYGSGSNRLIIDNATGLSISRNFTREAEVSKKIVLNISYCSLPDIQVG